MPKMDYLNLDDIKSRQISVKKEKELKVELV
jgi:hypothetical protein